MIPKVINYCWFGGGKKSKLTLKCIHSWEKFCPDYQIIEWNESNFDIDQHPYLRWCYDNKKWAFLSDFARVLIIYNQGGIYLDTDVELVRKPDELLQYEAFYGFENDSNVASGLGFGAVPFNKTVKTMIEEYEQLTIDDNGNYQLIGCPILNTKALLEYGLVLNGKRQSIDGAEIFPADYFNPYDDPTGRLRKTKNTYSIHWYGKSWMSKKSIIRSFLMKPIHRIFGTNLRKRS